MGFSLNGDLLLLHSLNEGCLRAGSGPVQFISQNHIGKDGTGYKCGAAVRTIKVKAENIGGQYIWCTLDPLEFTTYDSSKGASKGSFSGTRETLNEHMPLTKQGYQEELLYLIFTYYYLGYFGSNITQYFMPLILFCSHYSLLLCQIGISVMVSASITKLSVPAGVISQPRVSQIAKKGKTGKASIPLPPPLEASWPSVKSLLLNQADRAVRLGLRDLRRGCIGYENHRVDKWVQEVSVCPEAVAALAKMEKAVEAAESLIKTAADQLKCVAQSMPTDPIPPSQDRQELLLINARQKNLAGYCAELGCWERAEEDGLCWVHGDQGDHTTVRESPENNSPFAVMKSRVAIINSSHIGTKPSNRIYNVAVEKIAQYHRLRGDEVYAGPWVPMMLGRAVDKFYFSVIFTWDIPAMIRQVLMVRDGKEVEIGGPAATFMHKYIHTQTGIEPHCGLDDRFERVPGQYSLTFSSRGCPHRCAFCGVKKVEPDLLEYDDFPLAPMIGDNNILATSWEHQELVVNRFVNYGREIDINSGFDVRFFTKEHLKLYSRLRLKYWRFAWDTMEVEDDVRRVAAIMRNNGLDRHQVTVYALIGFPGQTVEECLYRLNTLIGLGLNPFAMRFWPLNALKRDYVAPGWTEDLLYRMSMYYQIPNIWMSDSFENFRRARRPE